MSGWWWNWNSRSGQFGHVASGRAAGSGHGFGFGFVGVASACLVPFVQPGSPTSPFALDQPPEYQAQLTCASLSRSPMVGCVCGGSRFAWDVPGAYG